MEPDTRSPELVAADRELLIALGRAEEAMAKRDALATTITASGTPRGTSGTHISRMAAEAGHASPSPNRGRPGGSPGVGGVSAAIVTASAAGDGIAAGAVLADSTQLASVMSETLRRMQQDPVHFGRKHRCATARWAYPEERQLGDSLTENTRQAGQGLRDRNTAVRPAHGRPGRHRWHLLADERGLLHPDLEHPDRPLRDGLPAFQATRGGIQYMTPPDLGVPSLQGGVPSGAGLATGVWTEATDANPAGATKPVWQVACGSPVEVYVDAIPTRVQFGNMQIAFLAREVAANTEQAVATAAREAELKLLTTMYAASKQVLPAQYLGATRDLLASVDLLIAQYRYSHRIASTASFTAVFPEWAKSVIRADMARELSHDNTFGRDVLAITDEVIDQWFGARGINVVWTLDGLQEGTYGTGGSALPNQFFRSLRPEPHRSGPTKATTARSWSVGCSTSRARSSSSTAGAWTSASSATRCSTPRTITRPSWNPSRASRSVASRCTRSSPPSCRPAALRAPWRPPATPNDRTRPGARPGAVLLGPRARSPVTAPERMPT